MHAWLAKSASSGVPAIHCVNEIYVGRRKHSPWPLALSFALTLSVPVHVFAARALRLDVAKSGLQLLQLLPNGRPPQVLLALDVLLRDSRQAVRAIDDSQTQSLLLCYAEWSALNAVITTCLSCSRTHRCTAGHLQGLIFAFAGAFRNSV